jgi:hypothetical protein
LSDLRGWVHELTARNVETGTRYLDGTGAYPERLAILSLTGRFIDDYLEMIDRWAAWATEIVDDWPADPGNAAPDIAALAATVSQARARMGRWRPPDANSAGTEAVSMPAP